MTNEQRKEFDNEFGEFWKSSTEKVMISSIEKLMNTGMDFYVALELVRSIFSASSSEYGN